MRQKKRFILALSLVLLLSSAIPAVAYDSARDGHTQTMSGGGGESFVIDGSGTLWAWGSNEWGQLGDGTNIDRTRPVKVLENVRSVSAGESHTYAVLEDNTLWAWGRNVSNAFPDSDLVNSPVPVKIMDGVTSASTGVLTHLALKTDGTLWAWGKYVGDRTNAQRSSPVKILDNVSAACTGFGHSLALKMDGSLYAWGQNNDGEVGDGSGRERPTPIKVLEKVVHMSAGYGFSAAVKADGTLWTWGRNWQGELGDGTIWTWGPSWDWHSPDPEEEALLQDTLNIWIEMWGPEANRDHSIPTQVLDKAVGVYASNNNCYALRSDGSLWAWGNNTSGDVGDGTTTNRLSPVMVMQDVAEVSVGWDHVLAKKTDGSLWAWGSNVCGQLGNGESGLLENFQLRFSALPIQVTGIWNDAQPSGGNQPAVSAQAAPTNDPLTCNGAPQEPTVYKIDGSNYFKIRDLAAILNGTSKQFSLGYDSALGSVTASTGEPYQMTGTELQGLPDGGVKTAEPSQDIIYINGGNINAQAYKIDGSNYFKLRDLGKALNFYVGWTAGQGVYIETDKPYSE